MADVGLGMGVESIQAGAEVTVALWGLEFCPRIAVNIEVVITRFPLVGKFISPPHTTTTGVTTKPTD
jgi:hypothetical protein